jgi:hypothetical protein
VFLWRSITPSAWSAFAALLARKLPQGKPAVKK